MILGIDTGITTIAVALIAIIPGILAAVVSVSNGKKLKTTNGQTVGNFVEKSDATIALLAVDVISLKDDIKEQNTLMAQDRQNFKQQSESLAEDLRISREELKQHSEALAASLEEDREIVKKHIIEDKGFQDRVEPLLKKIDEKTDEIAAQPDHL